MFALAYVCISSVSLIILRLDNIEPKRKSFLIAGCFAVFAFFITPTMKGNNLDMVRYLNDLNVFRSYRELSGVKNTLKYMYSYPVGGGIGLDTSSQSTYGGIPGMLLLMLIFSYLPSKCLISFAAFIVIYCSISLISNISKQYGKSTTMLVLTAFLFFALLPFMKAISGFRTFMVASVFGYCSWLGFTNKKEHFKFWVIYFFLLLIHPFITVPLVLLILTRLFANRKVIIRLLDLALLFVRFAQNVFIYIVSKLTFIPFFASIFMKSNQYQNQSSYSIIELIRSLLLFAVIILAFICAIYWTNTNKKYNEFMILLISFTLGSFYNPLVFGRYVTVLLFTSIPYLCRISKWKYAIEKDIRIIQILLFVLILFLSLLMFVDNLRAGTVYVHLGI